MINQILRYLQSIKHLVSGKIQFNKRLLNLNVFISALILIIVLQTVYSYHSSGSKASADLLLLKNAVYSSNYDALMNRYDPKEFQSFDFEKKCDLFFDELHKQDNSWILNNFATDGYDDNYINFADFLDFKRKAEPDTEFNEKKILELEKEFNQRSFDSVKVDKKIVDAFSILRVFGKCFIESDADPKKMGYISSIFEDNKKNDDVDAHVTSDQHELCHDTEARIFPWLSNISPTYKRWNGYIAYGAPDLADEQIAQYDDNGSVQKRDGNLNQRARSNCFLKNWKNSINGKGIVISASDGQKDELMKLALVLRALNNDLPIQIVHKGDLSEKNQKELIKQFRRNISPDNLPLSVDDLHASINPKFPPQDVWFVDVSKCINEGFRRYFNKYANKLLAYFFNSFEDMILIDTDTIPFVDVKSFFKMPGFVEKGAFFFQDRQLKGSNTQNQVNYFKRLFPSKLDTYFFNIPQVTDFTLKNRFIGDLRNHFMESGVVAINRKTHFTGMLAAVQLNFWSITAKKVHGDKELFWLGQSIAGNENYEFNALGAAAVGELTPNDNKQFPNSKSNEICGNHPGHIDGYDNKTLLWINSGFTFCKNTGAAQHDAGKPLFKNFDGKKLEEHYKSVTKIRSGIVPPPQEIEGDNDDGNPFKGWSDEHKYCFSYTWCAYEKIGPTMLDDDVKKGLLVTFDEEQQRTSDFLGDIWMKGIRE